ncbi:hypothetical protein KAH94_05265, partial [bacterium]|nr:hypothetical protein [bacterium]
MNFKKIVLCIASALILVATNSQSVNYKKKAKKNATIFYQTDLSGKRNKKKIELLENQINDLQENLFDENEESELYKFTNNAYKKAITLKTKYNSNPTDEMDSFYIFLKNRLKALDYKKPTFDPEDLKPDDDEEEEGESDEEEEVEYKPTKKEKIINPIVLANVLNVLGHSDEEGEEEEQEEVFSDDEGDSDEDVEEEEQEGEEEEEEQGKLSEEKQKKEGFIDEGEFKLTVLTPKEELKKFNENVNS